MRLSELQISVASAVSRNEIDLTLALPSSNVSVMLSTLEELLRPVKFNCDEEYYLVSDQRGYNVFTKMIARKFQTSIKYILQRISHTKGLKFVDRILLTAG